MSPRPKIAPIGPSGGRSAPAWALGLALGFTGALGTARAEPLPPELSDAEAGTPRAAAADRRAGHFFLAGKVSLLDPAGSIARDLTAGHVADSGPSFGGIVGIGLSRYAVLEATASYALLNGECTGCQARSFDAALGFSYHLAQGIAFDPWISYGVGYRSFSYTAVYSLTLSDGRTEGSLKGLDFARIAIGGDFYPAQAFGFGPFVEMDLGTFVTRPEPDPGASVHAFFQVGVRVALDPVSLFAPASLPAAKSARAAALTGY